jgi:hypothetical protein
MTQNDFDNIEEGDIIGSKRTLQCYKLTHKLNNGDWMGELVLVNDYPVRVTSPYDWYLFKKRKEIEDEI